MRLDGKVAIVTGGASGFGRATCTRLAEEGARVVVADLDGVRAKEVVGLVAEAGSEADAAEVDVSTLDGAARAVELAVARFGGLDVLVNNAGIVQGSPRDTWDCDEEVWDRVLRVNLKSAYACTKAAVPHLRARGAGSIVNVASIAASVSVGGAAYAASKGGMLSYTRHIARELAPEHIRANCVSPGFMRSPMTTGERAGLTPEEQEARIARLGAPVPMGHAGATVDIANAILYLAGDESAYVSGQEIVVDGAYLVR